MKTLHHLLRIRFILLILLLLVPIYSSGQVSVIDSFDGPMKPHSAKRVSFRVNANLTIRISGQSNISQSERIVFQIMFNDNISLWSNFDQYDTYVEVLLTRFFEISFDLIAPANTTIHFLFLNYYDKFIQMQFTIDILEIHTETTPIQFIFSFFGFLILIYFKRIRSNINK